MNPQVTRHDRRWLPAMAHPPASPPEPTGAAYIVSAMSSMADPIRYALRPPGAPQRPEWFSQLFNAALAIKRRSWSSAISEELTTCACGSTMPGVAGARASRGGKISAMANAARQPAPASNSAPLDHDSAVPAGRQEPQRAPDAPLPTTAPRRDGRRQVRRVVQTTRSGRPATSGKQSSYRCAESPRRRTVRRGCPCPRPPRRAERARLQTRDPSDARPIRCARSGLRVTYGVPVVTNSSRARCARPV